MKKRTLKEIFTIPMEKRACSKKSGQNIMKGRS